MSNESKGMDDGLQGRVSDNGKARYVTPRLTPLGDFRTITATGSGSQNETPAQMVINKMP